MELNYINKDIIFNEEEHKYFTKDGRELLAVSNLINIYKPKFDENGFIARACAKRDGVNVTEILEKWEKAKTEGINRGRSFHNQVEHFIKTGEILEEDFKDVVTLFSKIKFKGKLYSEIGLHDLKYGISGTADLICLLDDKNCELYDFKTNKKIEEKSKYKSKLLFPLQETENSEIGCYSIQLNLYKYMLEEHGYNVKKITLYHINPETRKIDVYSIPDIQKDIKKLLNHYKRLKEF